MVVEEVLDEVVVRALGEEEHKPELLSLQRWMYRLALQVIDHSADGDMNEDSAVHLEQSARKQNVKASDEPELQFHQPDESITGVTVIADGRVATPEQILASDETLRLIASALRDVGAGPREAFILYAIEGFGVEEISAITSLPTEKVLACISAARDHLRKSPGLAHQFQGRIAPSGAA